MSKQQGQLPTDEDIFYITWARETIKNNFTLCNDILKQLITISSALLGLSIIYEQIVSCDTIKIFVLLSFFTSLIVALFGLLPYEKIVSIISPEDIKIHKRDALMHKRRYLWASAIAILVGFALIIGELISSVL